MFSKEHKEIVLNDDNCSFYIYGATKEWSLFYGRPCEIKPDLKGIHLDTQQQRFSATLYIPEPNACIVQGIIFGDFTDYDEKFLVWQLEKTFYQKTLMRQREQKLAIIQLMGAMNSTLKIKTLLQTIMDFAILAIPVIDRGFLMLFNPEMERLYTVASAGVTERIFDYAPQLGEGMAGYTFQTGVSGIYNYHETLEIMSNVTKLNLDALTEAVHLGRIENNTSMAVPITFHERKLGIMIVHQYTNKRAFQQSDLRLLESFASQAAVAIRNAEAYEEIERLNAYFVKQHEIHQLFIKLSLQNVQEMKIIQTTKELLQLDVQYVNLADRKTFLQLTEMDKLATIKKDQYIDIGYVFPIRNERETFGYLIIQQVKELTSQQRMIIENAAISLTLKSLQIQAAGQTNFKERFELFQQLISGRAPLIDSRYDELGLDIKKPTFVVKFKLKQFSHKNSMQFIQHIQQYFKGQHFIFTKRETVVWVLQGDTAFRQKIKQQLTQAIISWVQFYHQQVAIGIGAVQDHLLKVTQSAEESRQALRHALHHAQKEDKVTIFGYEDLGINRLFSKQSEEELGQFVHDILAPLYKLKDETLLATLRSYIHQNRSISKTASTLHIHQNTLYHRLEKIEQLLNRDLHNPAHYLEIHLALHLSE
ncbi:helix-turn-helix domain-containing protein [Lysinibacillus sp. NPDC059133]|uniref:helix-turn-helix domain-containing protein n=1 Tax=Lysinibacillus sp. NPDC059133 TaxID=3346737 RepID=UPI003699640E